MATGAQAGFDAFAPPVPTGGLFAGIVQDRHRNWSHRE